MSEKIIGSIGTALSEGESDQSIPIRGEGQSTPADRWLGTAAQLGTAAAGVAYGYGWIICARFYSHFGMTPEEAGISFDWLAVRAFLIALAVFALIFAVRLVSHTAERFDSVTKFIDGRVAASVSIVILCVGSGLLLDLGLLTFLKQASQFLIWGTICLCLLVAGKLIFLRAAQEPLKIAWNAKLFLRGASAALVGFTVVSLVLLPYRLADKLSQEVREGRSAYLPILPGIDAIHIEKIRVILINSNLAGALPRQLETSGLCLMNLGGSDGSSFYFDPQSKNVFRFSDQNVSTINPCLAQGSNGGRYP
jgi:hypothetical protein